MIFSRNVKRIKRIILGGIVGVLLTFGFAHRATLISGTQTVFNAISVITTATANSFTSTAASGSNGFSCTTNGCRIDVGAGANDYFTSDGTIISTPATFTAGSLISGGHTYHGTSGTFAGNGVSAKLRGVVADGATAVATVSGSTTTLTTAGAVIHRFCADTPATCATPRVNVRADGGVQLGIGAGAAPACAAGLRGTTYYTPGGAGVADTYLVCCKNAADAYAWQTPTACGT